MASNLPFYQSNNSNMKLQYFHYLGQYFIKIMSALLIFALVNSCSNEESSDSSNNEEQYLENENSSMNSNSYIQKESSIIKASDTNNSYNNFSFNSMKFAREIVMPTFPNLQGGKIYKNQEPFGTQVNVHYDDFYKSYDIRFTSEKEKLMSIEWK